MKKGILDRSSRKMSHNSQMPFSISGPLIKFLLSEIVSPSCFVWRFLARSRKFDPPSKDCEFSPPVRFLPQTFSREFFSTSSATLIPFPSQMCGSIANVFCTTRILFTEKADSDVENKFGDEFPYEVESVLAETRTFSFQMEIHHYIANQKFSSLFSDFEDETIVESTSLKAKQHVVPEAIDAHPSPRSLRTAFTP
jgi:hypothetical protein